MLFNPIEPHEAAAFLRTQDAPAMLDVFTSTPDSQWYAARTPDGTLLGVSAFAPTIEVQERQFQNTVYAFVPAADRGKNIGSFLLIWTLLQHQSATGFTGLSEAPDAQTRLFLQRNHFHLLGAASPSDDMLVYVRHDA
ncbi:hypothetical protein K7W42_17710 [Deinococcus sp. HMF7604]|uniref:hypothetical protein n=1 Tax=Deinococcus betulae TaxID=2873312 RepID=UPI001CCC185F|nr:hypothetical protein [Deinococcus betulae]MBZ9752682.1 hypothetical protein [Deinococcus betulae]